VRSSTRRRSWSPPRSAFAGFRSRRTLSSSRCGGIYASTCPTAMLRSCWSNAVSRWITLPSTGGCSGSRRCWPTRRGSPATAWGQMVRGRDIRQGQRGLALRLPGHRPGWAGHRRARVHPPRRSHGPPVLPPGVGHVEGDPERGGHRCRADLPGRLERADPVCLASRPAAREQPDRGRSQPAHTPTPTDARAPDRPDRAGDHRWARLSAEPGQVHHRSPQHEVHYVGEYHGSRKPATATTIAGGGHRCRVRAAASTRPRPTSGRTESRSRPERRGSSGSPARCAGWRSPGRGWIRSCSAAGPGAGRSRAAAIASSSAPAARSPARSCPPAPCTGVSVVGEHIIMRDPQIIGFISELLPRCPDPDPRLPWPKRAGSRMVA